MDNMELKHGEWEDHKYIAKVPLGYGGSRNPKYRYFYDMHEYVAYLKGLSVEQLRDMALQYDYSNTDIWAEDTKEQIKKMSNPDSVDDLVRLITDRTLGSDNGVNSLSELNKKTRAFTPDEDWQVVNEYYEADYGAGAYTENCASCTAAYDLRRRGYDVVASGISVTDDTPTTDELLSWYNGAKIVDIPETDYTLAQQAARSFFGENVDKKEGKKAADYIYNELKKQGNGARGHLIISWYPIGGHSVVYEIVNNKVEIKDCQTFEKYTIEEDLIGKASAIQYIRTDNVEVNDSILDRVENRTGVDRGASVQRTKRGSNSTGYRDRR